MIVHWLGGPEETIPVQFNPTELQLEKQSQFAEIGIPGLIAPLQQFVRGQAEVLTLELFFDTSDKGPGVKATSVTEKTDLFYAMARIEPKGHAPPLVSFHWGSEFPGKRLPAPRQNRQRREAFTGVVTSVRQTFTMWSRSGVPLRAKLNMTIREFIPLEDQLSQLNPTSPDRTHGHVLRAGESLSSLAHHYWLRPSEWRRIATDNGIEDPRRLTAGRTLRVPLIPTGGAAS
jgi:hypothetical protein